jgi:tetratricopeptide (TPR) repeat protein
MADSTAGEDRSQKDQPPKDCSPKDQVRVRFRLFATGLLLVAITLVIVVWYFVRERRPTLADARREFLRGQFDEAEKLASRVAIDGPEPRHEAAFLAADAAERQQRYQASIEHLERIPDSGRAGEQARLRSGDLCLGVLRQPWKAEAQFRRALRINSDNVDVHGRLSFLLGLCASSWEAIPHRIQLLRHDQYDAVQLFLLCVGDTALENADQLPALQQAAPEDPRVLLGAARVAADQQDYVLARSLLTEAAVIAPELLEVHVKLGQLLQENASPSEFAEWEARLPTNANEHPGVWAVRGTWSMMHDQPDSAIRYFHECVRRDPNHERSNYQLSQLLLARGDRQRAQPFLERSKRLLDYFTAVKIGYTGDDDQAALNAATIAEELGLSWEAGAWYRLLLKKGAFIAESQAGLQRLEPKWPEMPLARTAPGSNPAMLVEFADIRIPEPSRSETASTRLEPTSVSGTPSQQTARVEPSPPAIQFTNDAREAGLEFQYVNGAPLGTTEHRMYEFTGGGIAVLDYDGDGYPDLYLAQGTPWPPGSAKDAPLDRLFHNQNGRHYHDVTDLAGLTEAGFSQGVTTGDFDNDGFPDIYVANIGRNRFFHNNGDGTFTDVTEETGTAGEDRWSTSCVLADLNADGLPDLYVVNYLEGADVFDRVCPDVDGKPRSCSPRHFPAAQDQIWLNAGDGTFEDITEESGIVIPEGKGLGIVVGDFDMSGKSSIFIANDAVPNFYFVNQASAGAPPQFFEQAMINGLAVDLDGRPQACMGVAAGDSNGDGRLDLFVTNFFNECNTLYRQSAAGTFDDATRTARLYDVSLKMVGFGTQFLDADLDGKLDLVLVNGDVDDLRDSGRDQAQRPQCLWNKGDGTFHEIRNPMFGAYFNGKSIGRGLARLDWNRDGRDDFAVSHLDQPVALLTNRTATGRSVVLRLIGTTSSRDAIGAMVTCQIGSRTQTRHLTAGDGYLASNERSLVIGLGEHDQIDELEIRWPSGARSNFSSLQSGMELLAVEHKRTIETQRP